MGNVTDQTCREWRERLGPWALGHGDAAERAAVESHLAECEHCRAEAESLRRVGEALVYANIDQVGARPTPSPAVWDRIEAAVRHDRRRRRGLLVAAAAALAAVVIGGVLLLQPPPSRDVTLSAAGELTGSAALRSKSWGTEIAMEVTVFDGSLYNVWLERSDGSRVPAGSFRGVDDRQLEVTLASSLDLSETEAIGISTPDGDTVLREELG
jgi:anti-sigma factor RsiW